MSEWYQKNKEHQRKKMKEYYQKNREKIIRKNREYVLKSKDKWLAYAAEYYGKNQDKFKNRSRKVYQENTEATRTFKLIIGSIKRECPSSATLVKRTGYDIADFIAKMQELGKTDNFHKGFSFHNLNHSQGMDVKDIICPDNLYLVKTIEDL